MRKKNMIIFIIVLSIIVISGSFVLGFTQYSNIINSADKGKTSEEVPLDKRKIQEKDILNKVHQMANTLIVAEDNQVWGQEEITKEKIDDLISSLNDSGLKYKNEVIAILNRWKSGDFSMIISDHNYVWNLLDGSVGKAIKANEEAVKKNIANLEVNK